VGNASKLRPVGAASLLVLFASLAVLNLPAAVGSLAISDSARGALRGGVYGDREELGFDNLLQLDLSLTWPTTVLSFGYGPRFGVARVLDGTLPEQVTLMHDFDAAIQLREGRFTLDLRQDVSVGQQSFGQLYGIPQGASVAAPAPVADATDTAGSTATPGMEIPAGAGDPIRLGSGVQVYSFRSAAAMTYHWSRRWESTLDLGYSLSGADNPKIETLDGRPEPLNYPRIQVTDAQSKLMYDFTRTQRAGGVLSGQRGWSDRDNYGLVSLAAAYALRWTSHTNLDIRAGAAYRDSLARDRTRTTAVVPVGSASLTHSIDRHALRARFIANIAYEPLINVLQAVLQDRLTALASASLATHEDSVTLSLSGSQSFPTDDPEAAMFAGVSLAYDHQFTKWIGIEFGGQVVDQVTDSSVSSGTIWTVYAGLGAQLSPLRF
jgi:hypothetical protein